MHYEINVSKDGRHYFATAERSVTREADAVAMVRHFREVFPAAQGYAVTVSRIETIGRNLEVV